MPAKTLIATLYVPSDLSGSSSSILWRSTSIPRRASASAISLAVIEPYSLPPSPTFTPIVSVVEEMRVAAISASPRSRLRFSSRDAMSCCQARYAPPAAGTASLRGIRKFVANPSATVFISPDLPSLSTSFVRMTFTFLCVPPWAGWAAGDCVVDSALVFPPRPSAEVGGRALAHDPAAQPRLDAGLCDRVGDGLHRAGNSAPHPPQRAGHEPSNAR